MDKELRHYIQVLSATGHDWKIIANQVSLVTNGRIKLTRKEIEEISSNS